MKSISEEDKKVFIDRFLNDEIIEKNLLNT